MRSRLGHQLGPWNNNEQVSLGSRQYFREPRQNQVQAIILPKLQKVITYPSPVKQIQIKIRQAKQKNQQQFKINSVQIELINRMKQQRNRRDFYSTKKYKKLSSNPPMISFYNKKHPKIKGLKQKNCAKFNLHLGKYTQSDDQSLSRSNMSNINILQNYITSNQMIKIKPKRSQSFEGQEKQLGIKKSLNKLLLYLKNSENQSCWTQRVSSYLKNQQQNGISRYSIHKNNLDLNTVSFDQQQTFQPYKEVQKSTYLSKKNSTIEVKNNQ